MLYEVITLVPGVSEDFNQSLERAGRVADFLEFAELLVMDAFERKESCGGHFNEAYQTEEHEARRDDENFCHVAAWEHKGDDTEPFVITSYSIHYTKLYEASKSDNVLDSRTVSSPVEIFLK